MNKKFKLIRDTYDSDDRSIIEMQVNGNKVDFQEMISKKIKGTVDCQSRIKDLELSESKIRIALDMRKDKENEIYRIDKDNEVEIICLSLMEAATFSYARCFTDGLKSKLNYKNIFKDNKKLIDNHIEIMKFRHEGLAHPRDIEISHSGAYVYIDKTNNIPDLSMIVNCEYKGPNNEFLDKLYELIQFTKEYLITKQQQNIDKHMQQAMKTPADYGIKEIVEKLSSKIKIIII